MANKYMKKCSTLLDPETQMKTTLKFHVRWLLSRKKTTTKGGDNVG
jgi:hypothetical protein